MPFPRSRRFINQLARTCSPCNKQIANKVKVKYNPPLGVASRYVKCNRIIIKEWIKDKRSSIVTLILFYFSILLNNSNFN